MRPKQSVVSDNMPLDDLHENGIRYIELRSLDINPSLPLGIDKTQVLFLEAFLLFCLLEESPAICSEEQVECDVNDRLVAHNGRQPKLALMFQRKSILLQDFGRILMDKIYLCAELLGQNHQMAVNTIAKRIKYVELTPSAIMMSYMKKHNQEFCRYINAFAKQHKQTFLTYPIDQAHFDYLDQQAKESCQQQFKIEQADNVSFDEYLANYFSNYQ